MEPAIPTDWPADAIPVGARILSAAEIYDALTTARPYQEKMTPEEAVARMRDLIGTVIHPDDPSRTRRGRHAAAMHWSFSTSRDRSSSRGRVRRILPGVESYRWHCPAQLIVRHAPRLHPHRTDHRRRRAGRTRPDGGASHRCRSPMPRRSARKHPGLIVALDAARGAARRLGTATQLTLTDSGYVVDATVDTVQVVAWQGPGPARRLALGWPAGRTDRLRPGRCAMGASNRTLVLTKRDVRMRRIVISRLGRLTY